MDLIITPKEALFHHVEETVRALIETFPIISRLKMLRWWGGIVDMINDEISILRKLQLEIFL